MPLLFTSSFDLKIDAKNRLFVPAEIRKAIDREQQGTTFFMILGPNRLPWLYTKAGYERWLNQIPLKMDPDEELQKYMLLKFAGCCEIAWDEQGRLTLPEKYLVKAKIEKDVTLAGVGDHLELWNRAAYEKVMDDIWAVGPNIGAAFKM